ncbi:MAG TPA: hypothetical protein VH298_15865 [Jatrophihabitans sp.]|nr:hypothetical protein [Jatrophihabitans sp.]
MADATLCPSFHCADGALLIGVLGPDGTVGYLNPAPTIDPDFVAVAEQQPRPAEQRFRFAGPCATSALADTPPASGWRSPSPACS